MVRFYTVCPGAGIGYIVGVHMGERDKKKGEELLKKLERITKESE